MNSQLKQGTIFKKINIVSKTEKYLNIIRLYTVFLNNVTFFNIQIHHKNYITHIQRSKKQLKSSIWRIGRA